MHDARGLTVVEVLVAFALTGVMFAATTRTFSAVVATERAATARDGARELVDETLEEADAYGCGLATAGEGASQIARWQALCHGQLGDARWTATIGATSYTVDFATAWVQFGAKSGCVAQDRPARLVAAADGLARTVSVQWDTPGVMHTIETSAFASVPPDAAEYHDTSRGALVLSGTPGEAAAVSVGSATVARVIGAAGCALFPFLPAGTVSWRIGAASGTATTSAATVAEAHA